MFDTVLIDTKFLPVSAEEQKLLSKTDFQTKSLEKALLTYRITEDGYLEYQDSLRNFIEQEIPASQSENWIRLNEIHGYVSFYTSLPESKEWYEFVAKFTDGKLVEIFRNYGQRFEGNRKEGL